MVKHNVSTLKLILIDTIAQHEEKKQELVTGKKELEIISGLHHDYKCAIETQEDQITRLKNSLKAIEGESNSITVDQITDKIYNGDSTKDDCLKVLDMIHQRLGDTFYESAPEPQEQIALDALKNVQNLIKESELW